MLQLLLDIQDWYDGNTDREDIITTKCTTLGLVDRGYNNEDKMILHVNFGSPHDQPKTRRLLTLVNDHLHHHLDDTHMEWTTLKIYKDAKTTCHRYEEPNLTGWAAIFVLGIFEGSKFEMHRPNHPIISDKTEGQCFLVNVNTKFRLNQVKENSYVMIASRHPYSPEMTECHHAKLKVLKFRPPPPNTTPCTPSDIPKRTRKPKRRVDPDTIDDPANHLEGLRLHEADDDLDTMDGTRHNKTRSITELCAGATSVIGMHTPESSDCNITRITIDDDILTPEGFNKAWCSITGPTHLLYSSSPCKGGSPYTYINWSRGNRETRQKILLVRYEFRRMFRRIVHLSLRARAVGARIAMEWPAACIYWRLHIVRSFIRKFGLDTVTFHGCALGLTSIGTQTKGMPIKKPWKIASDCPEIIVDFRKQQCDGSHVHARCQGADTPASESYTPKYAQVLHLAHRRHCQAILASLSIDDLSA